ncbi:MAG: hypothetical protein JWM31_1269 [Solirubrobacterales bacterium]|nr:hypothetical protein [Solirubrobacterales bacterium]
MATKKDDPTVTSADAEGRGGLDVALPVEAADDHGQKGEIKDNPDKPDPSSVAQVQVLADPENRK